MNLLLTLISLFILLILAFGQYIKSKRFEYVNNINIIYDKMEMHFVKKNIHLNKDYIDLLKTFKRFCVNPEYLDIQILLLQKLLAEKKGVLKKDSSWFDDTLNSLGDEFKEIFEEFDKSTNEIITLSIFKPDFVFFITKYYITSVVSEKAYSIKKLYKEVTYVFNNEEAISYSGMKLNNC